MKYIILVAGKARRLEPLTHSLPKCLFKLDSETTIIDRLVSQIKDSDKSAEIILVTGFKSELVEKELEGRSVTLIYNPFYDVTNNIASLWFAKDHLEGNVVVISGDFVLSDELVKQHLCSSIFQSQVLLDSSVHCDGDYNVSTDGERVIVMGKNLEHYDGEWIGVNRIHHDDTALFKETLCRMIAEGRHNQWHADVLSQMIFENDFVLGYTDVSGLGWTDIDTPDDLRKAKQIASGKYVAVSDEKCKE